MNVGNNTGCSVEFFISYNQVDREWAEWIAWSVEERGYSTILQAWDFKPGTNFVHEMSKATESAARTIAVLSPDYLTSPFARQELYSAIARDPMGEQGKLVLVRVRECELEGLLPQIVYIDLVGLPQGDAHARLISGIGRDRAKPVLPPKFPENRADDQSKPPAFPNLFDRASDTAAKSDDLHSDQCPYRGLYSFREEDAEFFFGRESFSKQLLDLSERKDLVAVIGPSGLGKSSVVNAGLLPQIRKNGHLIASIRPTQRPIQTLCAALVPMMKWNLSETERLIETKKLVTAVENTSISLEDLIGEIENKNSANRLFLIVDQFEELYTLCGDVPQREQFLKMLLNGIDRNQTQKAFRFSVILTLRADFLGHALAYRKFADRLQHADLKLAPMSINECKDAIEKPAELAGLGIDDGLVERILDAIDNEPGSLPILSFVLELLWRKQKHGKLTHESFDALGGIEQSLASWADEFYDRLSNIDKSRSESIFVQLVNPGEGSEDIRRVATRHELGDENWTLVQRIADERLVTTGVDSATGEDTVELVHEVLIRCWGRLNKWMHLNRQFRSWQERLRRAHQQWALTESDEGALLRGSLLVEAEEWLKARADDLNAEEESFITVSRAAQIREEERWQQLYEEAERHRRELGELTSSLEQRVEDRTRELSQANRMLENEQHLLQSLMDNTPDCIYFKDRGGRFIRVNRYLAQQYGLNDPSDAIGKTDFDFFSNEYSQVSHNNENRIMETGEALIGYEEKVPWSDGGAYRWLLTTKMPLRDPNGHIVGTFGVSREISELKQKELDLNTKAEELAQINLDLDKKIDELAQANLALYEKKRMDDESHN